MAFRRLTLQPLYDCLYALQPTIPYLSRSALHCCRQRHGISQLPGMAGEGPAKQKVEIERSGNLYIDLAEVRTEKGNFHFYVGFDRTSKFVLTQLHDTADRPTPLAFFRALIEADPLRLLHHLHCQRHPVRQPAEYRDDWTACACTASIRSAAQTPAHQPGPFMDQRPVRTDTAHH